MKNILLNFSIGMFIVSVLIWSPVVVKAQLSSFFDPIQFQQELHQAQQLQLQNLQQQMAQQLQVMQRIYVPQEQFAHQARQIGSLQNMWSNAQYQMHEQLRRQDMFLRQLDQQRQFWSNYWLRFLSNRSIGIGH